MRVAIDIDKTYLAAPVLFDLLAERFQAAGHEVGILTARSAMQAIPLGFQPDFAFYLDLGEMGHWVRARIKAQTMRRAEIDMVFDDHAEFFPPDVVALNIISQALLQEGS